MKRGVGLSLLVVVISVVEAVLILGSLAVFVSVNFGPEGIDSIELFLSRAVLLGGLYGGFILALNSIRTRFRRA